MPVDSIQNGSFLLCESVRSGFALAPSLIRRFGLAGALKTLLKLSSRSRKFYCVLLDCGIVNYGWVNLSFCRHYDVSEGDVVIGPVWTDPAFRRRGMAVYGIKMLVNEMFSRGYSVFFIDTAETNLPMQKVISKCGFGAPVSSYERNGDIR